MPAILEDPSTTISTPPSLSLSLKSNLPQITTPIKTTLKSGVPVTLYPVTSGPSSLPQTLIRFLHREFSTEIERGCTYPMEEAMGAERFKEYWFGMFAVVALIDLDYSGALSEPGNEALSEDRDWEKECLGTFYVKPNYPGRCSHVCNAGFLTTGAVRNQGVGMVMGKAYLHFAPLLGYKYSVFNLVFENNVASVKIWEKLGFDVIGRVPGAARLANSEKLVDALIIGKDLVDKEVVVEE
ncbi:GNAT family acetyltransferase [Aspergillus cavernicola]|uniref:GNAT family acetyltransferase n=1 Tax=Aspergillus cavernicola TaxID=176166 RepID=A0ABR4HM16_9EURO